MALIVSLKYQVRNGGGGSWFLIWGTGCDMSTMHSTAPGAGCRWREAAEGADGGAERRGATCSAQYMGVYTQIMYWGHFVGKPDKFVRNFLPPVGGRQQLHPKFAGLAFL